MTAKFGASIPTILLFVAGLFGLLGLTPRIALAATCDYYAAPAVRGTGDGLSEANAFQIADFWTVAGPRKTLCLLDGVFTGARSMITPPNGLGGMASAPITVRALSDGAVRINGQGTRRPVLLVNNSYFILEGFDAHNSSATVIAIQSGSHNNIVRRVVAWDAPVNLNTHVWVVWNSAGNLLEDVAGFGAGRKVFLYFSTSKDASLIIRRAWGMYNGSTAPNRGKLVYALTYRSYNAVYENVIGTWDEVPNMNTEGRHGILAMDHTQPRDGFDPCVKSKYLGSIAYMLDGQRGDFAGALYARQAACMTYDNVVSYVEPAVNKRGFEDCPGKWATEKYPRPCFGNGLRNSTAIGVQDGSVGSQWTSMNNVSVDTVAQAPNIWNGAGDRGARVCKRYKDGVLTDDPLWPWPMDARIRAALTAAGRDPDAIFRGKGSTLTNLMERIFGTLPPECRGDARY